VLEAGAVVVLQGVLLGLLAVGIVGVLTFALEQRLPYRRMLIITGVLIGGVLLTMVGHTMHVMQAVGWLPISPIRIVSIPYWMGVWLGIYPTWQGIVGQTGAACFVIGSYYLAEFLRARERSRAGGQAELAEAGM
jgi:high-affinity iron transporter